MKIPDNSMRTLEYISLQSPFKCLKDLHQEKLRVQRSRVVKIPKIHSFHSQYSNDSPKSLGPIFGSKVDINIDTIYDNQPYLSPINKNVKYISPKN